MSTNKGKQPPFKKGDWVYDAKVSSQPTFGIVRRVDEDFLTPGKRTIDLYVYDHKGVRIGRQSPALDGPTTFEPRISADRFRKMKEPEFPLKLNIYSDWKAALEAGSEENKA